MRRPLFSIFSKPSSGSSTPSTFGQHRAERMEQRLQSSIKERRTLARAEAATVDPLQSNIQERGTIVSARIDRLSRELNDEQQ
jgi:hypothetical protein